MFWKKRKDEFVMPTNKTDENLEQTLKYYIEKNEVLEKENAECSRCINKLERKIVELEMENKSNLNAIQRMKEQSPSNQCLNNIQRDIFKEIQEINSKLK
ncbi:hypothetical protein [Vagococcus fluvialis]|uniref:hypothetical protein n=1 Tax=Vagococcus fluvialis TaxID=2738 RepID=UPI003D111AFE